MLNSTSNQHLRRACLIQVTMVMQSMPSGFIQYSRETHFS